LLGNPAAAFDEITLQVAGQRDRPAKAKRPQPQKIEEEVLQRAGHDVSA
jgi:hypothetical protein